MADVIGQRAARRALEVTAAGGHHVLVCSQLNLTSNRASLASVCSWSLMRPTAGLTTDRRRMSSASRNQRLSATSGQSTTLSGMLAIPNAARAVLAQVPSNGSNLTIRNKLAFAC